ncbi:MAG: hypothetical protein CL840_08975 [Crocinitomicaceae bacterium]|nr:hypothetical protein [Crocinitomicaceae bacterium]
MNRIVIVGNGFDLAHGLKTGYEDFLMHYFNEALNKASKNQGSYQDELISVYIKDEFLDKVKEFLKRNTSLSELVNDKEFTFHGYVISDSEREYHFEKSIRVEAQYEFFEELINDGNWSDIESQYFRSILRIFKKNKTQEIKVQDINKCLGIVKTKLIKYLTIVNEQFTNEFTNDNIFDFCLEPLDDIQYSRYFRKMPLSFITEELMEFRREKNLDHILVLNFNYTKIFQEYLAKRSLGQLKDVRISNIHGSLNDPDSIIFGYGDDTHPSYKELEDEGMDSLLENIKSFYYPSTKYYLDFINFIESEVFDVYVVGHSLGLSDRVLLKTIFESENCKAIRLFHRGTKQSHFKKRISLSRHFEDKQAMRKKIVEYDQKGMFT